MVIERRYTAAGGIGIANRNAGGSGINEMKKDTFYLPDPGFPDIPRECPKCNTVAHYSDLRRHRKTQQATCPFCSHIFRITLFKRGERPKGKKNVF